MPIKLLTKPLRQQLIDNHETNAALARDMRDPLDHKPVVKIFSAAGAATWLLTELDPVNNMAFGLCDLGLGSPEIGHVSMDELAKTRDAFGLPLERDLYFDAALTLSEYADRAREKGLIVA